MEGKRRGKRRIKTEKVVVESKRRNRDYNWICNHCDRSFVGNLRQHLVSAHSNEFESFKQPIRDHYTRGELTSSSTRSTKLKSNHAGAHVQVQDPVQMSDGENQIRKLEYEIKICNLVYEQQRKSIYQLHRQLAIAECRNQEHVLQIDELMAKLLEINSGLRN